MEDLDLHGGATSLTVSPLPPSSPPSLQSSSSPPLLPTECLLMSLLNELCHNCSQIAFFRLRPFSSNELVLINVDKKTKKNVLICCFCRPTFLFECFQFGMLHRISVCFLPADSNNICRSSEQSQVLDSNVVPLENSEFLFKSSHSLYSTQSLFTSSSIIFSSGLLNFVCTQLSLYKLSR